MEFNHVISERIALSRMCQRTLEVSVTGS
jgi:hypothetical protein